MADSTIIKAQKLLEKANQENKVLQQLFKKYPTIPEIFNYLEIKDQRKSKKDIDQIFNAIRYSHAFDNSIGTKQVKLEKELVDYFNEKYPLNNKWSQLSLNSLTYNPKEEHKITLNNKETSVELKYEVGAKITFTNAYSKDKDVIELTFYLSMPNKKIYPLQGECTLFPKLFVNRTENAYVVYYNFLQECFSSLFQLKKNLKSDCDFMNKVIPYLKLTDFEKKELYKIQPQYHFGHINKERKKLLSWYEDILYTRFNLDDGPTLAHDVLEKTFILNDTANKEYSDQLMEYVHSFFEQKIISKYKKQILQDINPLMKSLKRPFKINTKIYTRSLTPHEILMDLKIDMG